MDDVTKELLHSHDELRAAIIMAGKEIRKLQFGKKDSTILRLLRKTLREAREARRMFQDTSK